MTLRPGVPFDRGDGVVVVADGSDFDFRTVYVPHGVVVRCATNPGERLRIRVAGDVRIDGEWLVDAAVDGASSATLVPSPTFDAVLRAAPTSIVCGGRWSTGAGSRIGATTTGAVPGRDLAVLVSGAVDCATPLGARILLAVGVETDVRGATPTLRLSEWPAASSHRAAVVGESWTRWYPLGHAGLAGVECELDGAVGDVQVFAQVASPDPFDPLRPDLTPAVLSVPVAIPNAAPLYVPPDGFVRFLLRGASRADAPPPSLSGISILARP